MSMDQSEFDLDAPLDSFPGDPSLDVCPTQAISWNQDDAVAVVDSEKCVGCGLCISRCPYGAISLENGNVARVEVDDPDSLIQLGESVADHSVPIRTGTIGNMDAPAAAAIPLRIRGMREVRSSILVRNLLTQLGTTVRVRRPGDTNVRIDAAGQTLNGRPVAVEIELSDPLDAPRTLLEDIAILHSRYGYSVSEVDAVTVLLELPSNRSEYYRVIRDIETVLEIRCRTITLGALVVLLWHNKALDEVPREAFVLGEDDLNLRSSLGIDVGSVEPYPGAFVPPR